MYLKSIEVQGFKSFANKILFEFHNGITGIVGPNGSGKSNVADAVRWVLGEQSVKQLRGSSMQDVIFSGTQNRKPLGSAFVAITLDNHDHSLAIDYEEVTIARRLYRSGESEYLINDTVCRLRDVHELFYDTGIGKEGYSIIGQGQIDKILSGKPEDRRELFDEAAGIVKFKRRKNDATKKLENEKQNLTRVNDILSEIERQLGPLEKQSEKAKIYLRKKEELKNLDVNVFLLENQELRGKLDSTTEKYDIADKELAAAKENFAHIKDMYGRLQTELENLEARIAKERETLSSTNELRSKLELQIGVLTEQIKSASDNQEHLALREKNVGSQIAEKETEKNAILEEKKEFDVQIADMQSQLSEKNIQMQSLHSQIEKYDEEIEESKRKIIEALQERATIKSSAARFESMLEQANIKKSEMSSRLLRARSDEEKQEEEITKLEEAFEAINVVIRSLNDEQSKAEEEESQLTSELSGKDQKLRDTQVKYHEAKSKYDMVSNYAERYDGYSNSIRKVMEQKEHNPKIIGVVADILKVDRKYEVAIETALGGNIQNIVTEDEEAAKKMISFLKQNKFGRATFLPLTSITNPQKFKTPEVLDEKGVIGMACDLVGTDKKYENVAKAMLGRIVVVDTVDNALKIARKYEYGIRMVTLEGELLVPGGAISGGAFKNASNLLSKRREADELEKKVKEYLKEIDTLMEEIAKTKEQRTQLRMHIEDIKGQIQKKFLEQNTARLSVIQAKEKQNETGRSFERLKEESKEIEGQIREIQEGKQKAADDLQASLEMEKQQHKRIEELTVSLEDLHDQEEVLSKETQEMSLAHEKVLQKQEFMQENVDRINNEIGRIQAELEEIVGTLSNSQSDTEQKKADIEKLQETIQASYTSQGENQEKLEADIAKQKEISEKQKNFFTERESLSDRINALDKEVFRLGSQKEKYQEMMEAKINYMWDEYEITLSVADKMKNPELTDLPGMKREISDIRDEIKKLGDVNVNAIDDYREQRERYTQMSNQHDDLVRAEEALRKMIEELDEAMRNQFNEKFAQISVEFDKVFKEMFGGGQGTLELLEDEDVLEAGIRIIAQPPGKKLQNMMQLSGGEKALTAIALLFAIQNLKPSPFCLLDEIEAALDDSNVGRFAKYLHKLTKHTQFIVITHRRGTMESADRLYGITMQEKGVSALVSVNLIEKDLSN